MLHGDLSWQKHRLHIISLARWCSWLSESCYWYTVYCNGMLHVPSWSNLQCMIFESVFMVNYWHFCWIVFPYESVTESAQKGQQKLIHDKQGQSCHYPAGCDPEPCSLLTIDTTKLDGVQFNLGEVGSKEWAIWVPLSRSWLCQSHPEFMWFWTTTEPAMGILHVGSKGVPHLEVAVNKGAYLGKPVSRY